MALDPLDMTPERLMARLINAGLRLARVEGLGMGLVNALRFEYPDVPLSVIGEASRTIGAGIRAAQSAAALGANETLALESIPVIPSVFFHGVEENRVIAFADVPWQSPGGLPGETWDVRINCGEGLTLEELIECITTHFAEGPMADYPDEIARIVNEQIAIYFMGRRF